MKKDTEIIQAVKVVEEKVDKFTEQLTKHENYEEDLFKKLFESIDKLERNQYTLKENVDSQMNNFTIALFRHKVITYIILSVLSTISLLFVYIMYSLWTSPT